MVAAARELLGPQVLLERLVDRAAQSQRVAQAHEVVSEHGGVGVGRQHVHRGHGVLEARRGFPGPPQQDAEHALGPRVQVRLPAVYRPLPDLAHLGRAVLEQAPARADGGVDELHAPHDHRVRVRGVLLQPLLGRAATASYEPTVSSRSRSQAGSDGSGTAGSSATADTRPIGRPLRTVY